MLTNRSRVWLINHLYHHVVFTDFERQNKIYLMNSLYSGDFVIAGFVIAGLVFYSYFTVILPGFEMLFVITGSSL